MTWIIQTPQENPWIKQEPWTKQNEQPTHSKKPIYKPQDIRPQISSAKLDLNKFREYLNLHYENRNTANQYYAIAKRYDTTINEKEITQQD